MEWIAKLKVIEQEIEDFLSSFAPQSAGQERARMEDISAKKQDKNEEKQPVKIGCRR